MVTADLYLAQADGGLPTMLAAGSAPGESGVSVVSVRFRGGAHVRATLRQLSQHIPNAPLIVYPDGDAPDSAK